MKYINALSVLALSAPMYPQEELPKEPPKEISIKTQVEAQQNTAQTDEEEQENTTNDRDVKLFQTLKTQKEEKTRNLPPGTPPAMREAMDEMHKALRRTGVIDVAVLRTEHEDTSLEAIFGSFKVKAHYGAVMVGVPARSNYMTFFGNTAPTKIKDKSPTFYFSTNGEFARNSIFLVKLDNKKNERTLKIGKTRVMSAEIVFTPNVDRIRSVSIEKIKEGIYKMTLNNPLSPGEYGIYLPIQPGSPMQGPLYGCMLFDFTILK